MNPAVLRKLQGRIAVLEFGHRSRSTPELITGAIAGLCCDDAVLVVVVPKASTREVRDHLEPAVPDLAAPAGTVITSTATPGTLVPGQPLPPMGGQAVPVTVAASVPPAVTVSNVKGIRREVYTDFHVRLLEVENVLSVEYFSGVRVEITLNKIFSHVPPERFFDDLPDKVEKPDGTFRAVTDKIREATHQFAFDDVMTSLREAGFASSPTPGDAPKTEA